LNLHTPPDHAPVVHKNSLRYLILLYVTTDPAYSWTAKQMIAELRPMGHGRKRVIATIRALTSRGLMTTTKWRGHPRLMATSDGIAAIRRHIPIKKTN